jgi:hypothetical protein
MNNSSNPTGRSYWINFVLSKLTPTGPNGTMLLANDKLKELKELANEEEKK